MMLRWFQCAEYFHFYTLHKMEPAKGSHKIEQKLEVAMNDQVFFFFVFFNKNLLIVDLPVKNKTKRND